MRVRSLVAHAVPTTVRPVIAMAVAGSALLAAACAPPAPDATALAFDAIEGSVATSVSDGGTVYGRRTQNMVQTEVVVLDGNGVRVLDSFGFHQYGYLEAANNHGVAVGMRGAFGSGGPFINWPRRFAEGGSTDLPDAATLYLTGTAKDINDAGTIVGTVSSPTATSGAVWTADGGAALLPMPPSATATAANGINERGDIAGSALIDGVGRVPVVWEGPARTPRLLATVAVAGATAVEATDLNDAGIVIGAATGEGVNRAIVWASSTGPAAELRGAGQTQANGLNEAGTIVGRVTAGESTRAVLWPSSTDRPVPLGGSGQVPSDALDVNESGVIVGYALIDGRTTAARFARPQR